MCNETESNALKNKYTVRCFNNGMLSAETDSHPEFEMIFVLDGLVNVYVEKRKFVAVKDDAVLIFPNQIHRYQSKGNGSFLTVKFSIDVVPYLKKAILYRMPCTNVVDCSGMENVKFVVSQLQNHSDCFENEMLDGEYTALIGGYLNIMMHDIIPKIKFTDVPQFDDMVMQKLAEYCEHHFEENISLQSVCEILGVSYYRVSRAFSKTFGTNFSRYINDLRISKACTLLKASSMSINDIAYSVGFDTIRNFNRVFSNIMQMSPTEYRARF